MTVLLIDGLLVKPGRQTDLLAMVADLKPIIRANGGGRTRLMRIAVGGAESGAYYGEVEFESMAAFTAYSASIASDPAGTSILSAIFGPDGPAERTAASIGVVIETFGTRTEGYTGGAEIIREIDVKPGRMDEVRDGIAEMTRHTGPLGAYVRSIRLAMGGQQTGRIATVAEYPDIAALCTFLHQTGTNPEIRSIVARGNAPDVPGTTHAISIHQEIVV